MARPELRVRFTKQTDGTVVLHCRRRDGSETHRKHVRHASFFVHHDLAHFAVETELGLRRGFYGLLADGWDIPDTEGRGLRGKLPPEAVVVEHVVSLFDRERSGGNEPLDAGSFHEQLGQMVASSGLSAPPRFGDAQLAAVRARADALHRSWSELPAGETLELPFGRGL